MLKEITSLQNPFVKHCVSLRTDKEYRMEKGSLLISGEKMVLELKSLCKHLIVQEGFSPSFSSIPTTFVSYSILKKITGVESPEGVAAEISAPDFCDLSNKNYILALDGISDPGNLGTLLRTAWALGWEGAFITKNSCDPFNEKALRAAKGATFRLPLMRGDLKTFLSKRKGIIYAADPKGKPLSSKGRNEPLLLILGNEAHGVAQGIKKECELLSIPMHQGADSLNVAIAGAILMHDLLKDQ
jgi:RNA methyltransferase, TrmH family